MVNPRGRFEHVWRWRQVSVWAPIVWFPAMLFGLLTGRTGIALALGLSGLLFAALTRAVVWIGHCPVCDARWGGSRESFESLWDTAKCLACGLSLFDLRRGIGGGR